MFYLLYAAMAAVPPANAAKFFAGAWLRDEIPANADSIK